MSSSYTTSPIYVDDAARLAQAGVPGLAVEIVTSLEAARIEAQRQQLYLEAVAQPNLADYPLYPKRIVSFITVFATCLLAYGLAWLLVANVREHSAA